MYKSILITGGTGSLGPALVSELRNSGYRIKIFAKDPPKYKAEFQNIDIIYGDLLYSDLNHMLENCEIIIHMAALAHINNPTPDLEHMYENINVEGTRKIVNAAMNNGVKRIIFFSTLGVYGPTFNFIADERTPPNPKSLYAISKLKAENIVLQAKDKKGNPISTVLRLATVYGPHDRGNFNRLAKLISKGFPILVGRGTAKKTLIYEKDVAIAVKTILNNSSTINKIYNVTDGTFHTVHEVTEAMCKALGKSTPIYYLPEVPIRYGLIIYEKCSHILGLKPKFGEWVIDKFTEEVSVSGEKFLQETGFRPKYDLHNGWNETIEILKKRGLI